MHISEYPSLMEVLRNNKKIIYIYGAGMSMALGEHRLTWSQWLLSSESYFNEEQAATLHEKMSASDPDSLMQAAGYVLSTLKENGHYHDYMKESFEQLQPKQQELIASICLTIRVGDAIATTNYDRLIEQAANIPSVSYTTPGEILNVINNEASSKVIHLHGIYDHQQYPDDIVADQTQYESIIQNAGAQFIQNLIGTHPIIFAGCGGTVSDPNLSGFIQFALKHLNLNIPYFYICKNGDTIPDMPSNVIPIYYGSNYDELPPFIYELTAYRMKYHPAYEALIQINPYILKTTTTAPYGRLHFTNPFHSFVGRAAELHALTRFANQKNQILWWTVTGEGGMGKSRLLLEWIRTLPSSWFGFFLNTSQPKEQYAQMIPYCNTVIVIDYVLGNEHHCASVISALISAFQKTSHKLRILLLERRLETRAQNSWYQALLREFGTEQSITFLNAAYPNTTSSADPHSLNLQPLDRSEEEKYVKSYLQAYFTAFPADTTADTNMNEFFDNALAKTKIITEIVDSFHKHLAEAYDRPLFLSIYAELWIYKKGDFAPADILELLELYMHREEERWLTAFGHDEEALIHYLNVLPLAASIDMICLNTGENGYLQAASENLCKKLKQGVRPGKNKPSWAEFFIWEQDSEEACMIFAPEYPDIIKEFIVDYYVDPKDLISFTKVARAQSTLEFALFLNRALSDFPEKESFVTMALTPPACSGYKTVSTQETTAPNEETPDAAEDDTYISEMFEYYATLLCSARELIAHRYQMEQHLLSSAAASKYLCVCEMELWRRMAVVLEQQPLELEENAGSFLLYLKQHAQNEHVLQMLPDTILAYTVGFYNAQAKIPLEYFLNQIMETAVTDSCIATQCAEGYFRLAELRKLQGEAIRIRKDVKMLASLAEQFPGDYDITLYLAKTAPIYLRAIENRALTTKITKVNRQLFHAYQALDAASPENQDTLKTIAGATAICLINEYVEYCQSPSPGSDAALHTSFCQQEILTLYEKFPAEKKVIMAYATLTIHQLMHSFELGDTLPHITQEQCEQFKHWFEAYPDEIEFAENYFHILFLRYHYIMPSASTSELNNYKKEMARIAKLANYDDYSQPNELVGLLDLLL